MKKAAIILAIFLVPVILIVGSLVYQRVFNPPVQAPPSASLKMWGTKPAAYYADIIATYMTERPYATIQYQQIPAANYRQNLVDAWAVNQGPDIFEFPADQTKEYLQFLTPAPVSTTAYNYERIKRFGVKEETQITKIAVPGPTISSIRQNFVDTVSEDAQINGQIYGLPLSVESLVLFSNRDLLNKAKIPLPAKTWNEFVQHVPALTIQDSEGNIIQSGASLGTAENLNHAVDIMTLLILQNGGTVMNTTGTQVTLASPESEQAVEFFTDFARLSKVVYSWNEDQEQALNAFAAGTTAYYFGYVTDKELIQQRSTGLNFDVSDMLQINPQQPINIANYSLYGVYIGASDPSTSWNFIQYMTEYDSAIFYHNRSFEIPARKDLISTLASTSTDPQIIARAGQALTAKTWYHGKSLAKAEEAFQEMINQILTGASAITSALATTAEQLRLTL